MSAVMPQGINARAAWTLLQHIGVSLPELTMEAQQGSDGMWHHSSHPGIELAARSSVRLTDLLESGHSCLKLGSMTATHAAQQLAWITRPLAEARELVQQGSWLRAREQVRAAHAHTDVLARAGVRRELPHTCEQIQEMLAHTSAQIDQILSGEAWTERTRALTAAAGALAEHWWDENDWCTSTAMLSERRKALTRALEDIGESDVDDERWSKLETDLCHALSIGIDAEQAREAPSKSILGKLEQLHCDSDVLTGACEQWAQAGQTWARQAAADSIQRAKARAQLDDVIVCGLSVQELERMDPAWQELGEQIAWLSGSDGVRAMSWGEASVLAGMSSRNLEQMLADGDAVRTDWQQAGERTDLCAHLLAMTSDATLARIHHAWTTAGDVLAKSHT